MTTPLGSPKKRRNSVKARANQHEKDLADKLGGLRQPMSGALAHRKGDIKLDDWLLDSKQTDANTILVTTKDLTKITEESTGEGLLPGLILTLKTPIHVSSEWAVVPLDLFSTLIDDEV